MTDTARLDRFLALVVDLDSDHEELAAATAELSGAGDVALVPPLEAALDRALDEGAFHARDLIGEVLAGIRGPAALPVLLRASARDLGDDQDSFSTLLVELARADPAAARETVRPLLAEPDAALRATGVWLLGFAAREQEFPLLAGAAADPVERLRRVAAGALGPLTAGVPEAVEVLVGLLDDPAPRVRIAALSTLGYARQARVLPAVRRLAADQDENVRSWAAVAAGRITGG
ncbi:HEAT repeat domain-containing protein [Kitasatospora sp. NPDC057198]|uniref:HEAT repeat domain-containing protein n=1 Tax=Kitasatospora sp. NPDC057198 TaxID=3346046 RepID=UPI003634358C